MCGRLTQVRAVDLLRTIVRWISEPSVPARYNAAPTQAIAAVRQIPNSGDRELVLLHWGLIPSWSKDPALGARMINARAETVADKPAFRAPFRRRRCLIPADGFYEWQKVNGQKQPFYIHPQDAGQAFAFAGLWDHWDGGDRGPIESCTILTTDANDLVRPLHNRMPVILDPADFDLWLDPGVQNAEAVRPLLRRYPAEAMACYPVGRYVNNPRNDGPDCIAPVEGAAP
jgi:putative SOS response-associated peptidase YedK